MNSVNELKEEKRKSRELKAASLIIEDSPSLDRRIELITDDESSDTEQNNLLD